MLQKCFRNKNMATKLKLILKNTITDKSLTYASETLILTKRERERERERKRLNIFERKLYSRILGPVYDKETECWRMLTNIEIYAMVKETYYSRNCNTKYNALLWTCTENGREQNSPKKF